MEFHKSGLPRAVLNRNITPGKVFGATLPLEQVGRWIRPDGRTPCDRGVSKAMNKRFSVRRNARLLKSRGSQVVAHVLSSIDGQTQIYNWPPRIPPAFLRDEVRLRRSALGAVIFAARTR